MQKLKKTKLKRIDIPLDSYEGKYLYLSRKYDVEEILNALSRQYFEGEEIGKYSPLEIKNNFDSNFMFRESFELNFFFSKLYSLRSNEFNFFIDIIREYFSDFPMIDYFIDNFNNLIGELSVSNLENFSKDELEEIFRNEYERD